MRLPQDTPCWVLGESLLGTETVLAPADNQDQANTPGGRRRWADGADDGTVTAPTFGAMVTTQVSAVYATRQTRDTASVADTPKDGQWCVVTDEGAEYLWRGGQWQLAARVSGTQPPPTGTATPIVVGMGLSEATGTRTAATVPLPIPTQSGEVARFTVTLGAGTGTDQSWYDGRTGSPSGAITGDSELGTGLTLQRVRFRTDSDQRIVLNRDTTGALTFADFVAANPDLIWWVSTSTQIRVLDTERAVGTNFWQWTVDDPTDLDTETAAGDQVNFVCALNPDTPVARTADAEPIDVGMVLSEATGTATAAGGRTGSATALDVGMFLSEATGTATGSDAPHTIPAKAGEVARFTVNIGEADQLWLDRSSTPTVGSATGDLDFTPDLTVDRVRWYPGINSVLVNRATGDASFVDFRASGTNADLVWFLGTATGVYLTSNPAFSVGSGNWLFAFSASDGDLIDMVSDGDQVNFVCSLDQDAPVGPVGDATPIDVGMTLSEATGTSTAAANRRRSAEPIDVGMVLSEATGISHSAGTRQGNAEPIDAGMGLTEATGTTGGASHRRRSAEPIDVGMVLSEATGTRTAATVPERPGKPTLITGTQTIIGTWQRPDGGGRPVTGFDVGIRPVGGSYTVTDVGNVLSYLFAGLAEATSYQIRVRARNSVGNSPWSTVAETTTGVGIPDTVAAEVLIDLAGSGTLIDVSDRITRVRGRYGRQSGLADYGAGSATVNLDTPDNYLTPGGGTYDANTVVGRLTRIRATADGQTVTLFAGRIETPGWQPTGIKYAKAKLQIVDHLIRLARASVDLPNTPAELTGARVGRILDAAGLTVAAGFARDLDAGTVQCAAGDYDGNALTLIRRVGHTEAGRFVVVHGDTDGGVLRFIQRGVSPASVLTVTDTPDSSEQITFDGDPLTESDPELLVTAVNFTDASGTKHTLENAQAIDRYGRRELSRTVLSNAADTAALATWWLSIYGVPRLRVVEIRVAVHLESPAAAAAALAVTVGTAINVELTPPGTNLRIAAVYQVDGVGFDMYRRGDVTVCNVRWAMLPPEVATFWVLGESLLGTETVLAPADNQDQANTPGGRRRWADGADDGTVTAPTFGAMVTTQVSAVYATRQTRDTASVADTPKDGQWCVVTDEGAEYLWRGVQWQLAARVSG